MSGTENLETRPVRVLRHRFEMSARLSQKTIEILKLRPGAFQNFGTKRVAIEGIDYYQYRHDLQIKSIEDKFRNFDEPIDVTGELRAREATHGRVQLAFQVQLQAQFDELLSRLDTLPNLLPKKSLTGHYGHYIVVDVAASGLLQSRVATIDAVPELAAVIADPNELRLYSFRPLNISGYDDTMRLPEKNTPKQWQDVS